MAFDSLKKLLRLLFIQRLNRSFLHTRQRAVVCRIGSDITNRKDRFQGVFYISDVAGHECETSVVDFRFWPNDKYVPSFKDEAGQPYTTEISGIYFSNDPRKIAVQFAYMFSIAGEKLMSASSDKESSFLVVGASSREDAVSSYIELLYNSK